MGSDALNSAISGMQSDSTWLDVIGNNISNSNTIGFKSSSVSFANQFNQTLFGGAGDNASSELGGIDPQSVGTGTRIQTIQTNFTQGTTQQTGVTTDISIQGSGFLVTKSGNQTYLTRAGNLTFDSQGFLVDSNGAFVQGYTATTQFTTEEINSTLNFAGNAQPLNITNASLTLNNLNPAAISNIQINPNMTLPPQATTQINFQGNLDAAQQANQTSGGILNLAPNGVPILPCAAVFEIFGPPPAGVPTVIDSDRMATVPVGAPGGFALQQLANLSEQIGGQPVPLENGFTNLAAIQAEAGGYAWELQPPLPPATQMSQTVYDSLGSPHQITIQLYQVNDIGSGGVNSAAGPSQTCYAWYAFDTTGGQQVSTANLVAGTGIGEGDLGPPAPPGPLITYDRGLTVNPFQPINFGGDFLYFNTDGSLASSGGIGGPPTLGGGPPNFMSIPRVYIPDANPNPPGPLSPIPDQGAQILAVNLNFGTFGVLGVGRRDGLTGDADGTYQPVNGVNTYVPDSHITATQNGYQEGALQGLSFDQTGSLIGSFSNGQKTALAQVALANVNNEGGLSSVGNNDFQTSVNSGAIQMGLATQNGLGSIEGGTLEDSNVNLTDELSNMIIAQRGFDTNARVISAVSSELQTITQLGK
jgi:flagellar hook-basal body protein